MGIETRTARRAKKKRAYSMWGYEVSACQQCGRAFPGDLCIVCRRENETARLHKGEHHQ